MATTYTDNLNLQQPDLDDDALITVLNNDMAIIDRAVNGVQNGLAIVANGNTHVAISAGQFVYVRNHTTLTEGLYVASSNIAANATLSTSNLTADSAGGLNALNSKITTQTATLSFVQDVTQNNTLVVTKSGNTVCMNGRIKVLSQIADLNTVLFTLPAGFHKSSGESLKLTTVRYTAGAFNPTYTVSANTNGEIKTNQGSTTTEANSYIYFDCSFQV